MTPWQLFLISFYVKDSSPFRIGVISLLILLSAVLLQCQPALGWGKHGLGNSNRPIPYDIHLTEGRICRQCLAQFTENGRIRLIDKIGRQTVVDTDTIIGINRYPLLRRLLLHSARNIGNSGPVIVPYAFENAQDYLYKYYPLNSNF